ncbi:MAG: response regulator transcription factor [bacterium]|nr:response regulator transcription factor [bacterium]
MKRILVVEDETSIQKIVFTCLTEAGYEVCVAGDGREALEQFNSSTFDLILLDIMLPYINGYEVCKKIRESSNVPIIMLTALDDENNQIKGFSMDIDDYITKPFSMSVVVKRVEAVLRRASNSEPTNMIHYKNIAIDLNGHVIYRDGKEITLTTKEFEIVSLLVKNQGRVFTRDNLLDSIWGIDYYGDERLINTHIRNIRRKLGDNIISTVRGVGYRVDKEN